MKKEHSEHASARTYYLKPDVQIEPLVNSWYAWHFLVCPATAALTTANLHLRLLDSFLSAPDLHIAASRNPAMRGGPFINYDGDVCRVRELVAETRERMSDSLEFAKALTEARNGLLVKMNGHSLENLYQRLPAALRGYTELGYDLDHRPSLRLVEPLLYRSALYKPALQSVEMSRAVSDDRAFVLSTPRVPRSVVPRLNMPFASTDLDSVLAARNAAVSRDFIEEVADRGLHAACDKSRLLDLFTETPPVTAADRNYDGPGVRIRYFGHATLLVQTPSVTIMTDPIVPYAVPNGALRYHFADLPDRIDYVLLTHAHQDHVVLETMLQIRHKVRSWVVPKSNGGSVFDPSLKLMLKALGFQNVIELDEMESIEVDGGRITGVPFLGEHGDLLLRSKLAYHVRLGSTSALILADSNNLDDRLYEHIRDELGEIDLLFVGMECAGAPMSWLYGPLFGRPIDRTMDQSRRLNGSNFERASGISRTFRPKEVYVYAMGQEPWLKFISSIEYKPDSLPIVESDKLVAHCRSKGARAERLHGRKELLCA